MRSGVVGGWGRHFKLLRTPNMKLSLTTLRNMLIWGLKNIYRSSNPEMPVRTDRTWRILSALGWNYLLGTIHPLDDSQKNSSDCTDTLYSFQLHTANPGGFLLSKDLTKIIYKCIQNTTQQHNEIRSRTAERPYVWASYTDINIRTQLYIIYLQAMKPKPRAQMFISK